MEFILGLLVGVVFFIALIGIYYLGFKHGKKGKVQREPELTADEEDQRRAKEHRKAFMSMMNYDVDVALQKKKVT
jgi:cbb3-type cytochrome oxidase subunit 3